MSASTGLPIEPGNLDDTNFSIQGGRRGNASSSDKSMLVYCVVHRHIAVANRQVLQDRVIDRTIKCAKFIIVRFRQVEIHARGAVGIKLHARDKRAVKILTNALSR